MPTYGASGVAGNMVWTLRVTSPDERHVRGVAEIRFPAGRAANFCGRYYYLATIEEARRDIVARAPSATAFEVQDLVEVTQGGRTVDQLLFRWSDVAGMSDQNSSRIEGEQMYELLNGLPRGTYVLSAQKSLKYQSRSYNLTRWEVGRTLMSVGRVTPWSSNNQ